MPSGSSRRHTVLVVDDSPFIRRVVRDVIAEAPDFEVVGEAVDGYDALGQVHALSPDVVTLDVRMPGLDGLATLGYVMSEAPRPVVMLSAVGDGGDTTMRALELGAVDFVRKPAHGDAIDLATLQERLLGALRTAMLARYRSIPVLARAPKARGRTPAPGVPLVPSHVLVLAASTGGPRALAEIIPALAPSGAAIVIAQHMPAGFTESLARRLDTLAAIPVLEATHDASLLAAHAYVAPGGVHTTIAGPADAPRLQVCAGPSVHGVTPAADPLLESAADVFGAAAVAAVLTGMGQDGAVGARRIRAAGGHVVVQDEATSIVFGMPHATLLAGGADEMAPLAEVAPALMRALRTRGCEVAAS